MQSKYLVGLAIAGLIINTQSAQAQITPDATAGTIATPAGAVTTITGGTLSTNTNNNILNQFHSFTKFDVNAGTTATFVPAPDVDNILARVTGPGASIINGIIGVDPNVANTVAGPGGIANARPNLFLMNPSGIIFGPDSSLNVTSSFVATTASSIGLTTDNGATQNYFNATPGAGDTFATLQGGAGNMVFAPGFTGSVVNLGNGLKVRSGEILGLYGNSVASGGDITSPGAFVSAYSVPSPRTMRYTRPGNILTLEYPTAGSLTIPATGGNALGAGITPATLAELVTGGGYGPAATVKVVGGVVQLTGGGPAGADANVAQGELGVRNINVADAARLGTAGDPPLPTAEGGGIRLYSSGNAVAGNLDSATTIPAAAAAGVNNTLNFGGDTILYAGAGGPGTEQTGISPTGTVQVGNVNGNAIDIRGGSTINGGILTTPAGTFVNEQNSIQVQNINPGAITLGSVTSNNTNLGPAAGQSGRGNIFVRSTGNLTTGAVTNTVTPAANLVNGGGAVTLISGLDAAGTVDVDGITTVTNVAGASIDVNSGGTITGGTFTTEGNTGANDTIAPGRAANINLVNRRGTFTSGNITANNVKPLAGGGTGGGNIVVRSAGNLTAGNVSNNSTATSNFPLGANSFTGGDINLVSGIGLAGVDTDGITTVGKVDGASIKINSGGKIAGGDFTSTGYTATDRRPNGIDLTSRRSSVTTKTLLANNYNAQIQSAGGGNILVNAQTSTFNANDRITSAVLAGGPTSVERNLATSTSTGGAKVPALSAVSVAARGTTTINQLAANKFIQGGGLQADTKNIMIYRLASNPNQRVLISGINADGTFKLADPITGTAIPSGSIIIRDAATYRIGATDGGTNGLIVKLGAVAPGTPVLPGDNSNVVGGIAGETPLNTAIGAPANTFGGVAASSLRLDTLPVVGGPIGTEGPIAVVPPVVPPVPGTPIPGVRKPDGSAVEVERPRDSDNDRNPLGEFGPVLTSDALAAAGQEEGVLTQRVERQVAVPVQPPLDTTVIPQKKEELPLKKVETKKKPKFQTLPQLW